STSWSTATATDARSPSTSPSRTSALVATEVAVSNASVSTLDVDRTQVAPTMPQRHAHARGGKDARARLGPFHERDGVVEVRLEGGTGGGKTTAARLLAVRHGLRAFHVDAFWYAHDARLGLPELDPEEQWLRRTPERQARDFEERARFGTALVLEDLTALPREP